MTSPALIDKKQLRIHPDRVEATARKLPGISLDKK
jgi:hypothetical protein